MNQHLNRFIDDLLIVIVLHEMPLSSSKSWKSIAQCLSKPAVFFLYDNSSQAHSIPKTDHQILYHHDPKNAGVAKAYNEAWKKANQLNRPWLLLLDQDTEIPAQLLSNYVESITAYPENSFFAPILRDEKGIVSPFYFHNGRSKRISKVEFGLIPFKKRRAANSGALINTKLFDSVDGFNETLPLDFSDIFFQEKIMEHHPFFVILNNELTHHFSGSEKSGLKSDLNRYKIFCQSCFTMSTLVGFKLNYYMTSFKRALSLTLKHFSFSFILAHFRIWSRK